MSYPTSIKGVLLVNGRVLLVKNPRGEWELPGGRGEAGEDHGQTLLREFKEELSVEVAIAGPIDSYLFEVIPGRHVFIVTYGCRLAGEFGPKLSDEHTKQFLWPIERLPELNLPGGYRRSIEKWSTAG
jgi:8-oxo-dGTP pyrophosphatase MutT (NUDIX family)